MPSSQYPKNSGSTSLRNRRAFMSWLIVTGTLVIPTGNECENHAAHDYQDRWLRHELEPRLGDCGR